MPRKSNVNYFDSRGGYYCQIRGQQKLLAKGPKDEPDGPTYKAALKEFWALSELDNVERAGETNTVRSLCETYLQRTEQEVAANTLKMRHQMLTPFVAALGHLPVSQLSHFRVEGFINDMKKPRRLRARKGKPADERRAEVRWGSSTVSYFLGTINCVLNWAVDKNLIPKNPLRGMKKPGTRSRSRDCIISPEQHQLFLHKCRSRGMRDILIALENTGCRPGEILAATAAAWDDERGALVYAGEERRREEEFRHKAARYKDRVIYFTGEALNLVRSLVARYPHGPLFRKSNGSPYKPEAIHSFFAYFKRRVGIPRLTAYAYRHTFATRWLLAGRSIDVLGELLGNTPAVIRKHYAHLCGDWMSIRQHLLDFKQTPGRGGDLCPTCGRPVELTRRGSNGTPSPGGQDAAEEETAALP